MSLFPEDLSLAADPVEFDANRSGDEQVVDRHVLVSQAFHPVGDRGHHFREADGVITGQALDASRRLERDDRPRRKPGVQALERARPADESFRVRADEQVVPVQIPIRVQKQFFQLPTAVRAHDFWREHDRVRQLGLLVPERVLAAREHRVLGRKFGKRDRRVGLARGLRADLQQVILERGTTP